MEGEIEEVEGEVAMQNCPPGRVEEEGAPPGKAPCRAPMEVRSRSRWRAAAASEVAGSEASKGRRRERSEGGGRSIFQDLRFHDCGCDCGCW